jgi:hypothetical protein
METVRMIQKGQSKYLAKKNVCEKNNLINKIYGLAAW